MKARILVVDDEEDVRGFLASLLEDNDYSVETAEDGNQAWRLIEAQPPDLILMDIMLAGDLNGIEATRRLLEEAPRTRVLALSIHSEKRLVDEMLRAGAAGYLLKDSAPEELVRAVRALLRGESYVSAPLIGTLISSLRQTPSEQTPAPSPGVSSDGARAPGPPSAGTGKATTQSYRLALRDAPPISPAGCVHGDGRC